MGALGPPRRRGTHSGVGKTTVATGLMAALRRRGDRVAPAKVGPDFIDPGYHASPRDRRARNLARLDLRDEADRAVGGEGGDRLRRARRRGSHGPLRRGGRARNRRAPHVARLLGAPVVLVVGASAMSGSVAALVHGYATFDPAVRIVGVVLNRRRSGTTHAAGGAGADWHPGARRARPRRRARLARPAPRARPRRRAAGSRGEVARTAGRRRRRIVRPRRHPGCRRARCVFAAGEAPTARPSGRARVAVAGGPRSASRTRTISSCSSRQAPSSSRSTRARTPRFPPGRRRQCAGGGFPRCSSRRRVQPPAPGRRARPDGGRPRGVGRVRPGCSG